MGFTFLYCNWNFLTLIKLHIEKRQPTKCLRNFFQCNIQCIHVCRFIIFAIQFQDFSVEIQYANVNGNVWNSDTLPVYNASILTHFNFFFSQILFASEFQALETFSKHLWPLIFQQANVIFAQFLIFFSISRRQDRPHGMFLDKWENIFYKYGLITGRNKAGLKSE